MAKTFNEVFSEIKENLSKSSSGKVVKSFNRTQFDALAKAFLNTPDYTVDAVETKGGEMVKKDMQPVKQLRNMVAVILKDFGVDKQEIERIYTDYEFRNVDGLYEVMAELIYQYMNAGKKFDFITREDFSGSLTLKEIGESVSEHKDIRTGEKFKVKKKAHKVLDKKSKAPKWLKDRI